LWDRQDLLALLAHGGLKVRQDLRESKVRRALLVLMAVAAR
jgi:hypothetical protein